MAKPAMTVPRAWAPSTLRSLGGRLVNGLGINGLGINGVGIYCLGS